jgi:hypothetical protein
MSIIYREAVYSIIWRLDDTRKAPYLTATTALTEKSLASSEAIPKGQRSQQVRWGIV